MDTTTNFPEIAEEEDDEYDELTPIASHCNTPKPCTLSSLSLLHAISLAPPHLSSLLHLHSRLHSPAMTRGMNIHPAPPLPALLHHAAKSQLEYSIYTSPPAGTSTAQGNRSL